MKFEWWRRVCHNIKFSNSLLIFSLFFVAYTTLVCSWNMIEWKKENETTWHNTTLSNLFPTIVIIQPIFHYHSWVIVLLSITLFPIYIFNKYLNKQDKYKANRFVLNNFYFHSLINFLILKYVYAYILVMIITKAMLMMIILRNKNYNSC